MKQAVWVVSLVLAFAAGWWLGRQPSAGPAVVEPGAPVGGRDATAQRPSAAPGSRGGESFSAASERPSDRVPQALLRGDGESVLDELDALIRRGQVGDAARLRLAILEQVHGWASAGQQRRAEALVEAYLARNPHDLEARLLHSDVLQMQGQVVPAMAPLLAALKIADEPAMVVRLREALRLLVNVHESQLATRQNFPALIRFFEDMIVEDPGFDGHRLALARWLLLAGRFDEAQGVLDEMGLAGVTPEARGDLEAEIRLARSGLPVRWDDRAMHVEVRAAGRMVSLLVDTGASTTAVSRAAADALGAEATGRKAQVRTAGGTVVAEVKRLRDFQVGELLLPSLEVLVMEEGPPGADGLLGMDVLSRFPGLTGGPTLLGRPASSG